MSSAESEGYMTKTLFTRSDESKGLPSDLF